MLLLFLISLAFAVHHKGNKDLAPGEEEYTAQISVMK